MSQFRSAEFLTAISDLHVLMFMATNEIMPLRYCLLVLEMFSLNLIVLHRDYLGPLYDAIRTKNVEAAREWSYLDHWSNMQALIQATTMN